MKVTMRFFTILKEIAQKNKEEIEVPHTTTVEELISLISNKYGPQFKSYVYNQNGQIKPYLQFLVNWANITTLNGFKTLLKEHDEIAIIPPVSGGSTIEP
ncbi:MoaD family protein [Candidatus Bathyarchaeota archaeon]|nr:MoaD family protein [Candidatus Bathyarchaeota archaeon]